jgi:hypothetical protein
VTLYSVRLRSDPKVLTEGSAEVALIEEGCLEGDLREWNACVLHERQSVTQPATHSIFPRRATEYLPKGPCEIDWMNSELLGHLRDLQ